MLRLIRGSRPTFEGGATRPRDELAALVTGVVRGEPRAARSFVLAIASPVRRAVVMTLGSTHGEVDDATQEAIMSALHALPRFRGECTATQFAVRIAVRAAFAVRRRQRARDRWVANAEAEGETVGADAEASPLVHVEAARRRDAIRRLLDELPQPIAEAVVLYFMLGYTVPEIAALGQTPVNTIWSRLRVGRERMRQALSDDARLCAELGEISEDRR